MPYSSDIWVGCYYQIIIIPRLTSTTNWICYFRSHCSLHLQAMTVAVKKTPRLLNVSSYCSLILLNNILWYISIPWYKMQSFVGDIFFQLFPYQISYFIICLLYFERGILFSVMQKSCKILCWCLYISIMFETMFLFHFSPSSCRSNQKTPTESIWTTWQRPTKRRLALIYGLNTKLIFSKTI